MTDVAYPLFPIRGGGTVERRADGVYITPYYGSDPLFVTNGKPDFLDIRLNMRDSDKYLFNDYYTDFPSAFRSKYNRFVDSNGKVVRIRNQSIDIKVFAATSIAEVEGGWFVYCKPIGLFTNIKSKLYPKYLHIYFDNKIWTTSEIFYDNYTVEKGSN